MPRAYLKTRPRALKRCEKTALPGKRDSGPKACSINDQPGADSRYSQDYSLQRVGQCVASARRECREKRPQKNERINVTE